MVGQFIGYQEIPEDFREAGEFDEPLFNVKCAGNKLDGSTVSAATLVKLGIKELIDRDGKRLLSVPLPKR